MPMGSHHLSLQKKKLEHQEDREHDQAVFSIQSLVQMLLTQKWTEPRVSAFNSAILWVKEIWESWGVDYRLDAM